MLRELSIRGVDRECFIDPTPLYPGELSQSEMATVAGGAAIGAALAACASPFGSRAITSTVTVAGTAISVIAS